MKKSSDNDLDRKKKKYSVFGALAGLMGLVSVLTNIYEYRGPYTNEQVQALLNNRFPGEAVSFQKKSKKVWNCWFDDLPEVIFQVKEATGGGDPVPAFYSYLACNASNVIWRHYVELYCEKTGNLDRWNISNLDTGETCFYLSYTTVEEASQAAEQLRAFYEWGMEQPHWEHMAARCPASIFCTFEGNKLPGVNPLRHNYSQRPGESCDKLLEHCKDVIQEYYACYLLPCTDFTQEELLSYAEKKWNWTELRGAPEQVLRGEDQLPLGMFSGIKIHGKAHAYAGVSFGGLYVMVSRLGFEAEGTPEHFTFKGADGSVYEFSYNFCYETDISRYSSRKRVVTVWYYLCDGVRVERETWEYGMSGRILPEAKVSGKAAEAMLGIQLIYTQ